MEPGRRAVTSLAACLLTDRPRRPGQLATPPYAHFPVGFGYVGYAASQILRIPLLTVSFDSQTHSH